MALPGYDGGCSGLLRLLGTARIKGSSRDAMRRPGRCGRRADGLLDWTLARWRDCARDATVDALKVSSLSFCGAVLCPVLTCWAML
eukprot:2406065-Rhodomonas_salina.8